MSERPPEAGLFACVYQPPAQAGQLAPDTSVLVATAADVSPRYEQHRPDLVSIDVRGLSRLFGSPRAIAEELRRGAAGRGVRVHVAVAGTRTAALVLAMARPGVTVVPAGDEAVALAPIGIGVLERLCGDLPPAGTRVAPARARAGSADAAIGPWRRWGIRTLGELAALPSAELASRLGGTGRHWQSIARGEDTRPLVPMRPEERFDATLDLEWPIEGAEPLSFVLTRLLEPLSTRLERRDRGAAVLHVALGLVSRTVHASRLELPSPIRDVRTLRTLALLDFERHPPEAAIDRVTITIEPTPGRILQRALFARPHPTPEQLSTLIARLGALMGQDRVGAPSLVDTYRPGAFAMTPYALEHAEPSAPSPSPFALSPSPSLHPPLTSVLRRCRRPIPARVVVGPDERPLRVTSDRRSVSGGRVVACAGPWRTSGAWWHTDGRGEGARVGGDPPGVSRELEEGPWSRDEWEVSLSDGAVYRIFQDRVTEGWFIEGILD